jgi:hypothetical protein
LEFFFLTCASDASFSFTESFVDGFVKGCFSFPLSLEKTSLDAPEELDRMPRGGGAKSSALLSSREESFLESLVVPDIPSL